MTEGEVDRTRGLHADPSEKDPVESPLENICGQILAYFERQEMISRARFKPVKKKLRIGRADRYVQLLDRNVIPLSNAPLLSLVARCKLVRFILFPPHCGFPVYTSRQSRNCCGDCNGRTSTFTHQLKRS